MIFLPAPLVEVALHLLLQLPLDDGAVGPDLEAVHKLDLTLLQVLGDGFKDIFVKICFLPYTVADADT